MTSHQVTNVPESETRFSATDNKFKLLGLDHVALPTRDIRLMERFTREVLGGVPYYYAGFDEQDKAMGRRPHIFARVGNALFQFTEEPAAANNGKEDPHISPHVSFLVTAQGLDENIQRLRGLGIPVAGPFRHRDVSAISAYFQTPEGHKLELCTYDPYPEENAALIGENGVRVHWPQLAYNWPT